MSSVKEELGKIINMKKNILNIKGITHAGCMEQAGSTNGYGSAYTCYRVKGYS